MPTDRYIIEFQTNYSAALAALDALAAKVAAVDAQLNALGARATTAGGTIVPPIPAGFSQNVQNATQRLQQLQIAQQTAAGGAAGLTTASNATAAAIARLSARVEFAQARFLAFGKGTIGQQQAASKLINAWTNLGAAQAAAGQSTAQATAAIAKLAPIAGGASAQMSATSAATDRATDSFIAHARRIAETVLVYGTLFAAIAAAKSALDLSITIDRESRRLEAVTGLLQTQSKEFVSGLADIAVETVTPLEDIVSVADQAAAAFLDLTPGAERAAATTTLLGDAGAFTTVTQRNMATETENLIGIMKQFDFNAEEMHDILGKIVVAGGNSSTVIAGIADALKVTAQGAAEAGTDFDTLTAVISQFIIDTGRTGSSVGQTFKTLFGKIADPATEKAVQKITDGILSLRDSAGELRDPFDIFTELRALVDQDILSMQQFNDILASIAPPLNPAALADLKLINRELADIGPRLSEIESAGGDALDSLVNKINSALGPRFQRFIEEAKRGFVEVFSPELLDAGNSLLNVLIDIRDIIAQIPPDVILLVGQFIAFAGAIKIAGFVVGNLLKLLGLGGVLGALKAIPGAMFSAAGATGALTAAVSGLGAALLRVLPLALAFAAIQIVGTLTDEAGRIATLREQLGLTEEQAQFVVHGGSAAPLKQQLGGPGPDEIRRDRDRLNRELANSLFGSGSTDAPPVLFPAGASQNDVSLPRGGEISPNQIENINRLAIAIDTLNKSGDLTPETLGKMKQAVLDANNEFGATAISVNDLIAAAYDLDAATDPDSINAIDEAYKKYLADLNSVTEAEKIAAKSQQLLMGLQDDLSSALKKLTDEYASGKISLDEYTQSQADVSAAAEQAAQLVAAAGDQFARIPELAGPAAQGTDELTKAIFDLIVQSGNTQAIDVLVQKIVQLAASVGFTSDYLRSHPFIITTGVRQLPPGVESAIGGFPEGQPGTSDTVHNNRNRIDDIQSQIEAIVDAIFRGITTGSTGANPSGPTGGGSRQQTPILDIGDLRRRDIEAIVAIATELRSRIPGAAQDSEGAIVSLIKDGRFLQTIRGIDDRLLRIAIQQLTDQMEAANDLAAEQLKKDALLRNLTVRTGPLGALISQPTTFGLGGSLAQGTGLNFDPSQGNFVINVPVELKGLEPAKLQQLIYNIISKAIRDAARL